MDKRADLKKLIEELMPMQERGGAGRASPAPAAGLSA